MLTVSINVLLKRPHISVWRYTPQWYWLVFDQGVSEPKNSRTRRNPSTIGICYAWRYKSIIKAMKYIDGHNFGNSSNNTHWLRYLYTYFIVVKFEMWYNVIFKFSFLVLSVDRRKLVSLIYCEGLFELV